MAAHGLIFHTSSDTEVILNAFSQWGIDALNRFQGPFAFALFDSQTEELWLCRDRFGVRPLYYAIINETLYFASTTPMLAKSLNLKPNLEYIGKGLKYLVYEDGSENTAYHQLYSLPAASYLRAQLKENGELSSVVKIYYDLADNVQRNVENLATGNTNLLLDRVNATLENAVKIRLRSDVPLAISLSGGA